jgi:protein-disulfide isomerase
MENDRKVQIWMAGGFLVVIVAIAVIAGMSSSGNQAQQQPGFQATTAAAITSTDWVTGDKNAKVSVIEYGDFQCPACGAYEPMVEQLEKQYASNVEFVFRNFPLPQHANAPITAAAAEAAGLQGKYWEMHDLLYQKQAEWSDVSGDTIVATYLDAYAQSLGLDVQKFNTDINSDAVKQKVQHDVASGNAAQVDHTPTFFVNLTQIPNPQSAAEFEAVINAALASSTAQQ